MVAYGDEPSSLDEEERQALGWVSVPFVLAAAIVCGVGLVLLFLWIVTFTWPYLSGIGLLILGVAMLMNRRAGLDRAA